jgi:C4-dicarboxylate-specific signal transduction histidine kinase
MGELTASLAHELNQPLGAILNNAQAARRFLNAKKPEVKDAENFLDWMRVAETQSDASRSS